MNRCDTIRGLLSELLDGELAQPQRSEVEAHVHGCDACRQELQELRILDTRLNDELQIPVIDEKIARAQARMDSQRVIPASAAGTTGWGVWVGLVLAASVLLAAFKPWDTRPRPERAKPNPLPISAQLVHATGPVDVMPVGHQQWQTVLPPARFDIPNGARVRTQPTSQCEIQTQGQGQLRLDRNCEIVVQGPEQVELLTGKLWCRAPEDDALKVNVPVQGSEPSEDSLPTVAVFRCPTKSIVQCESAPNEARCATPTEPPPSEPPEVRIADSTWRLAPGHILLVDGSRQVKQEAANSFDDVWQLPLLAISSETQGELQDSMRRLLAPIGRTKARHMNESQIRALGPTGAIPLLAFVIQEQNGDQTLRRVAMRLAAETADESAVPMLRQLTNDADAYIAAQATRVLKKLNA